MPCLGRRVTENRGWMDWLGASVRRNFWAIVARSSVASIMAKPAPTQTLGPPPKGK